MTVSVVLPVRDGERYLVEAIESVLAEGVDELVVVDDGSTDRTPEILARFTGPVVVLRQEASGQAAAINRGLDRASGDVIAFQDADDIWVPGRQRALLAALDPTVDIVYGAIEQFVSPELDAADAARLRSVTGTRPVALLGCSLVRRAAFTVVGPFDTTLASASNIDWMSRADAAGLTRRAVEDVVLRRRIHLTNMGRSRSEENRVDLTRVMRAHLSRRRSR